MVAAPAMVMALCRIAPYQLRLAAGGSYKPNQEKEESGVPPSSPDQVDITDRRMMHGGDRLTRGDTGIADGLLGLREPDRRAKGGNPHGWVRVLQQRSRLSRKTPWQPELQMARPFQNPAYRK